ncbi:uncharacterized protein LOC127745648 [Arachis duranensis]|uniref:Uncharacterized protein LOC127745648 n=1 Tax=Arachis duranensis TaxID=130453 RepID=A0A9C6TTK3_ARADU|nr:uncharacterized protein LOC127745648 [Arachis duranensis]
MAEGIKKKAEKSYTRVYGEKIDLQEKLKNPREEYAALQESVVEGMDKMFNNLKAQVQVLTPGVDLSLFSQDNIVVDGKIVPTAEDEEKDPLPDPKSSGAQGGQASQTPEVQPEIVNVKLSPSPPGAILAVLVSVHPPTPPARGQDVVTREGLNPLFGPSLLFFVVFLFVEWPDLWAFGKQFIL